MEYLLSTGFDEVEVTISNKTGTLHCFAKKTIKDLISKKENLLNELKIKTKNESKSFFDKVSSSYKNVSKFLYKFMEENKDIKIGFYPPLRAIHILVVFYVLEKIICFY